MQLLTVDTVAVPLRGYVKPDFPTSFNFDFDTIKVKPTILEYTSSPKKIYLNVQMGNPRICEADYTFTNKQLRLYLPLTGDWQKIPIPDMQPPPNQNDTHCADRDLVALIFIHIYE